MSLRFGSSFPLPILSIAAALLVTACAGDRGERNRHHAGQAGGADLYSHAMKLKRSGNCEAAERPLARLAAQGGGFEIAQYHLGDCMAHRSADMAGPERELLMTQGLHWLELAAGSGEPKAQARLVEFYIGDHMGAPAPVQSATWYLIFQDNPKRTFIEIVEVDPGPKDALFRLATEEDWKKAQANANAWSKVIQEVKVPDAGFPPDQTKKKPRGKGDGKGRGKGGGHGGGGMGSGLNHR